MWPPRCACSCGRCAGARSLPENSSGERTSTRFLVPIALTTSSRKARIEVSCSLAVYEVCRALRDLGVELAPVELPLLAAAVEQLHGLVAVELEVPVGVGREPVVVAAVEDDGVVVGDALGGQQLLEAGLVDEVAAHRVLQLGLPVELDGAGDVAAVVGGGVLVDLDEDRVGGVEVLLGPVGTDQGVLAAHVCCSSGACGFLVVLTTGSPPATPVQPRTRDHTAKDVRWAVRARSRPGAGSATEAGVHTAQVHHASLGEPAVHARSRYRRIGRRPRVTSHARGCRAHPVRRHGASVPSRSAASRHPDGARAARRPRGRRPASSGCGGCPGAAPVRGASATSTSRTVSPGCSAGDVGEHGARGAAVGAELRRQLQQRETAGRAGEVARAARRSRRRPAAAAPTGRRSRRVPSGPGSGADGTGTSPVGRRPVARAPEPHDREDEPDRRAPPPGPPRRPRAPSPTPGLPAAAHVPSRSRSVARGPAHRIGGDCGP